MNLLASGSSFKQPWKLHGNPSQTKFGHFFFQATLVLGIKFQFNQMFSITILARFKMHATSGGGPEGLSWPFLIRHLTNLFHSIALDNL